MSLHSILSAHDDPDRRTATCNLTYIRRRLGKAGWGDQRLASYVQALIEQKHFPAPFPTFTRKRNGNRALSDRVAPASTWQRCAVDQWFDDFLPPDAAAALDAAARAAAAADMDANAANLRLVAGNRR